MYQLTSGSTGTPKAVQITHANLLANSVALVHRNRRRCEHRRDGQLAAPVPRHGHARIPHSSDAVGVELVAATPEEFLRRPALWPDLITRYRGTITSGPNFAYALLALTLERRRTRQIRPVQPARRDQRRRTHRRPRRASSGPGGCPLRAAPRGDHPRLRHGRGHPRHHLRYFPRQVNVDRDQSSRSARTRRRDARHRGRRPQRRIGRPPSSGHGGPRRRRPIPTTPAASRRVDRGSRRRGVARLPHRERLAGRAHPGRLAVHR